MIGDAAHKRLLDNGWTWDGESIYTKTFGAIEAGQTLQLRGCNSLISRTDTMGRLRYARTHPWDFCFMNADTAWVRICTHGSFWEAAKAVLGTNFRNS